MKTVEDYMKYPRILNDRAIIEAPRCIREIHAIRLKIQDETQNMTAGQRKEYHRKNREAVDTEVHGLVFSLPMLLCQWLELQGTRDL